MELFRPNVERPEGDRRREDGTFLLLLDQLMAGLMECTLTCTNTGPRKLVDSVGTCLVNKIEFECRIDVCILFTATRCTSNLTMFLLGHLLSYNEYVDNFKVKLISIIIKRQLNNN